jgi:hypothetical protein
MMAHTIRQPKTLLADIILSEANPFQIRTGAQIDFVLLNHGSIRSIISNGGAAGRMFWPGCNGRCYMVKMTEFRQKIRGYSSLFLGMQER